MSASSQPPRSGKPADEAARRQNAATVTGVVVAGVLASYITPGPYSWGSTLVGFVLAAVLIGYGEWPSSWTEAVGYAAALAFVALLVLGIALDELFGISGWEDGATADDLRQHNSDGGLALAAWSILFGLSLLGVSIRGLKAGEGPATEDAA